MAKFEIAIEITLKHEGGFFHDTKSGEVVNMGITLDTLRRLGVLKSTGPATPADIEFVKSLTVDEAKDIYRLDYWEPLNLDHFAHQEIANRVFDLNVNTQYGEAARLLQRALGIKDDGIIGPKTIQAENACAPDEVMAALRQAGADYYKAVVAKNPIKADKLDGWLHRLNS